MKNSTPKRIAFKIRNSPPEENKKDPKKKDRLRKREIPALILGFFALIAVSLYLLGYGVALSAEYNFLTPYSSLFGSSLELAELSIHALLQFTDAIRKNWSFWGGYGEIFLIVIPSIIFISLVWIGFVVLSKPGIPIITKINSIKVTWTVYLETLNQSPRASARIIKGLIPIMGYWIIYPLLCVIGSFLMIVMIWILMSIPSFGVITGNKYIYDYVIAPDLCAPLQDRASRIQAWNDAHKKGKKPKTTSKEYATCVRVRPLQSKDVKEYGQGRLVFSTSSAVILYDPDTGRAWRVPTKDAIIEVIDKL